MFVLLFVLLFYRTFRSFQISDICTRSIYLPTRGQRLASSGTRGAVSAGVFEVAQAEDPGAAGADAGSGPAWTTQPSAVPTLLSLSPLLELVLRRGRIEDRPEKEEGERPELEEELLHACHEWSLGDDRSRPVDVDHGGGKRNGSAAEMRLLFFCCQDRTAKTRCFVPSSPVALLVLFPVVTGVRCRYRPRPVKPQTEEKKIVRRNLSRPRVERTLAYAHIHRHRPVLDRPSHERASSSATSAFSSLLAFNTPTLASVPWTESWSP